MSVALAVFEPSTSVTTRAAPAANSASQPAPAARVERGPEVLKTERDDLDTHLYSAWP
ncbi:MAG TPA: hypothetical protein VFC19_35545 [Candidatus Limnocylindrales bacterium]|nr:hypothetical protein [Candidatus Limnocylindrales bacterium]